jgi:hypothetical protein
VTILVCACLIDMIKITRQSIIRVFGLFTLSIAFSFLANGDAFGITQAVGQYKAISIPLQHSQQGVTNVWDDVIIVAEFTSPTGRQFNEANGDTIGGFYNSKDLWMVRFAPDEVGTWQYTITLTDRGTPTVYQDSFVCDSSSEQGFIRLNAAIPNNRWYYSGSGKLYTPLGFGDCMQTPLDSILEKGYIDGGYRAGGINSVPEWILPYSQYLIAYGDMAGFNLYRYSDGNCAYTMVKNIASSGNDYDTLHCRWTDTLFSALRQHGFRIYMTILGSPKGSSSDPQSMSAVERYAQFCIDRFGSLVDFWELTNESNPDSLWISEVATYIHKHDPYHHLVSMSYETPSNPAIDIISPHWYGREDVLSSDQTTADHIDQYSTFNKPVIFGEQGEGALWDSLSPTRVRGRIWSALFNAGTIIFWNSSFAKDDNGNQYLGWPERREVRILENFSKALKLNQYQTQTKTIGSCKVWGLYSDDYEQQACYIRNDKDINAINTNVSVQLGNVAKGGEAIWYDVQTGDILKRTTITFPLGLDTAPPFKTDIAFIAGVFADSLISDSLFRVNVNPRTLSLIKVPVRSSVTVPIGIRNSGLDTIVIERAIWSNNSSGDFALLNAPLPLAIAPNDTQTLSLQYTPADTGIHITMLSLARTGSDAWENIAIAATAVPQSDVTLSSDAEEHQLTLLPNPADDVIMPTLPSEISLDWNYEVYSSAGQKMLEGKFKNGEAINVKSLPSGVFQLLLKNEKSIVSSQFVVLH